MTHIVPLNRVTHRGLRVDLRASAAYGDAQHFVQVIVNEFPQLVVHYPILFSKDRETGRFYCGVMLGFEEGENLFLDRWVVREFYRPLSLQRGPFYTHGQEVAIDLDHPRVGAAGGQPIFTEHGHPTQYLQSIIWAFQDLKPGIEMTRSFAARLTELGLIEPVDVEVECDDGRTRHCVGLYTVSEESMLRLPDGVLVELFRRGYLRLMHLMIASLKHIPLMARRKNDRILAATEGLAGARAPGLG